MDLCVKARSSEKESYAIVRRCIELGWDSLAWTQTLLGKSGAKTISPRKCPVAVSPADLKASLAMRSLLVGSSPSLSSSSFPQYSRLNVVVDDVADAQILSAGSDQFKHFDLLSATPGNGQVFAFLCKTADIDIISLDFSHRLSFPMNKKMVDIAVSRGILFEIQYSPSLVNGTRTEVFSGSANLVKFLRGRNILITSGAEGVQSLRGPFDVMNIACLLRLSEEQARASVTTLPLVALRHAEARKHKFLSVRVVSRSSYEETCARLATELVKRKADSVQEEEQKKSKKHHQRKGRGGKRKQSSSEESTDDEDDDEKEEEEEEEGITPTVSAKRSDLVVGSKRGQEEMKEEEQEEDDDGFLKL